jgi:hypothetical protein
MAKEFVTKTGEKFDHVAFNAETNQLVGVKAKSGESMPLYWSPRSLAILEGSTKRAVNPNYWVDVVVDQINKSQSNAVITDMRYKSEAARLKEVFGNELVTARIIREASTSEDPSERDLDDYNFDYYIDNKTTMSNYFDEIMKLASKLHAA